MKIWIDAQLPPTLANWLNRNFDVEAISLKELGLRDAKDLVGRQEQVKSLHSKN